jgi:hypothetical protein
MPDLLPLSVCSSITKYSCDDEGFALHVAEGDGERVFRARVDFTVAFAVVPLVHVGLAGFDIDRDDTARLHVRAEAITTSGFDVVLTTWRRTRVYGATVSWLAIG